MSHKHDDAMRLLLERVRGEEAIVGVVELLMTTDGKCAR